MSFFNEKVFSDPRPVKVHLYRNILTIKESQHLFDDLVDQEDIPILQAWDNQTSLINHQIPQINRTFQYATTFQTHYLFQEVGWRRGRFGNGKTYGVWYGALEEETSIKETLYWSRMFAKNFLEKKESITIDRKMYSAQCVSEKSVDLRSLVKNYPKIVHKTDYSFCHQLGEYAVKNKIGLYLTPSVRNPGGTCAPVFSVDVIKKENFSYYMHYTFYQDGRACVTRDKDEWMKVDKN